ncbi:hypothetical protein PS631_01695 [Pseudomonas fluorescens]|uniref:Uncharacterized protein n=1 Tax=Pseudomonas fluorescens TaxID=294 RepID=A0A5E6RJJ0_PSEFL|nr:hypothetical protein [Pseudomonas fluorescens]VVM68817.1 hypothetical protein PS631_01695 [Pseudomonas fluorescens]
MIPVCIIGVPNQIRRRIEQALEGRGIRPSIIIADLDRTGRLQLKPSPRHAADALRNYCDSVEGGYDYAEIYVLPYASIAEEVDDELATLKELNAQVIEPEMEVDGWPYLHLNRPKIDEKFLNAFTDALIKAVVEESDVAPLPSQSIEEAVQSARYLHVVGNGISQCDDIAPHRHWFVYESLEAFCELIKQGGDVGNLDEFFRTRGLIHAKTGGIATKLEIYVNGVRVREETHNTHLKNGDRTTREAAARIYYQVLQHMGIFHVFLMYVGPHPDTNISRKIDVIC